MITGKPFSTISYNTKDFLLNVLDDLLLKDHIEFYMFIWHEPEKIFSVITDSRKRFTGYHQTNKKEL